MDCFCCLRRERRAHSNDERFQVIREKMIDDFVSAVSADAMRRTAEVSGLNIDPVDDDVFVENTNEVTRDFSTMTSRFGGKESSNRSSVKKSEQQEIREDIIVRQRISQVLEMGAYQPGISLAIQNCDSESDRESESGIFMASSTQRKKSSLGQVGSYTSGCVQSNSSPNENAPEIANRRSSDCEQDLRKKSLVPVRELERSNTLCMTTLPEGMNRISSGEISTNFLDNVR